MDRIEAWIERREPFFTTIGAACAFVTAFVATWIAVMG